MRILVLGGTAWLGRAVAEEAVRRGHDVTCAARGSAAPPEGVTFVEIDRDDDAGLASLVGGWDAVVDVSRQPGQVRRAVRDLTTPHYLFVSSLNVYASFRTLEPGEDAPVREPLAGDVMENMETYGAAKVACEEAVRGGGAMSTVVRAGLIGGPGDWSGRTGYWPWRFAHPAAGEVVVPDDPEFPCAMIDVRDLATWLVILVEQRTSGTFNCTGPTTALREVLTAAADVARSPARPRPVAADRLAELGVEGWMGPVSLPLWIADPEWRGVATLDTTRARAAGLVTRPLRDTLADVLAWEETRTEPRRAGLSDDDERRVIAAVTSRPTDS
ncbi:MAG: NAD-dependent epimerase/dehydratase family protein [Phycicoccus sp.]